MEKRIEVEEFFELFEKELQEAPYLHSYYKFHTRDKSYSFRKAYFIQRLQYVADHINDVDAKVWDCGCGYGTTAIFLALNGVHVYGTTLEFYYEHIAKRVEFWKQYGNLDTLKFSYENLFDTQIPPSSYDIIIAQDTLHHLEPFNEAAKILVNTLTENGKIIAIEENGNNIVQNLKLYKQRGNKRIITIYDEVLKKDILLGNENIRSIKKWNVEFAKVNCSIDPNSIEYIRLFPPAYFENKDIKAVIEKEQQIQKKNGLLRKYFLFGTNFIVEKNS
jgi:SAM-dependent methyltransferase